MTLGDKKHQGWLVEEEEALLVLKAADDRGVYT